MQSSQHDCHFRFVPALFAVWLVLAQCSNSLSIVHAEQPDPTSPVSFVRDIRPILSENCFHCHGPDEEARQADLRLDTQEGAHDWAIVPKDVEGSELISRIVSDDDEMLMPPPDSERSLTPEQIQSLKNWVEQGGKYEPHWSFQRPTMPQLPSGTHPELAASAPIDQFIRRMLQTANVEPAEPADRETLIRRVTFTLTGLPPTTNEIDAFVSDEADDAYERLVDDLLSRATYGERMASDWLDVARYSDTYGYQVDRDRFVWPWRDWLIRALNSNMPYDQFITEQLAGDLIPDATRDQFLATTFNRLHPQKVEGGSVPEEFRIEYVADRTQTVGTAIMGLTFECCRCHTHKYDPIQHREYYQLSAFFDNIDEAGLYSYFTESVPTPTLSLPTAEQQRSLEQQQSAVEDLLAKLDESLISQRSTAAEWLTSRSEREKDGDDWLNFAEPTLELNFETPPKEPNTSVDGVVGKGILLTGDDPITTKAGEFSRYQPFSVSLSINVPDTMERAVIFHRSRAWTDSASRGYQLLVEDGRLSWSLIHFWPGNAISIRTSEPAATKTWVHVVVSHDGSRTADGLKIFVDGKLAETEVVRDALTKTIKGSSDDKGETITIGERFRDKGFKGGSIDLFRVFDSELSRLEIQRLASSSQQIPWLAKNSSVELNEQQRNLLAEHFLTRQSGKVSNVQEELTAARQSLCQTEDAIAEIMVMRELDQPRTTHRLDRGSYESPDEVVQAATPAFLPEFADDLPRNRLGLAKWLTSPDHPLTSRVAVNRLWQLCFGVGLVRTPEDFGSQGAPPTHPDLLDWLALDFVDSDWDVKRMLKQIVMSKTFLQSSHHRDAGLASSDPDNRLYARFPAYRLSAEMLRDNALFTSGRLVDKIGGPPAKPYEIEASFKPEDRDKGEGLYRRSLYTYWKRTAPAPVMMTLDSAKRDVCRVQRERTASPLQAFVLLNGPQYVEAARGLAEQLIEEHNVDNDAVLLDAYRILTSRPPSDDAISVLQKMYDEQLTYFEGSKDKATEYLSVGDAEYDDSISKTRLAATSVVVATLMNYDMAVMIR